MEDKIQGTISILAALLVLFSAMLDPWVSMVIAVIALLGLGILELLKRSSKDLSGLIEKQAKEKEEHFQKIKDFILDKEKITNNDIEKLLGVSDATAERYLNELEKDGTIKQVGKTGKSVFYSKS